MGLSNASAGSPVIAGVPLDIPGRGIPLPALLLMALAAVAALLLMLLPPIVARRRATAPGAVPRRERRPSRVPVSVAAMIKNPNVKVRDFFRKRGRGVAQREVS